MYGISTSERRTVLSAVGVVRIVGPFTQLDQAWSAAQAVVDAATRGDAPLTVIGDFVIPPTNGPASRDFQTLHFDFGLPLVPVVPTGVARFTALHVRVETRPSEAVTRLVPLRPLLATCSWPDRGELVRRFAAYGRSHGAWDDGAGYTEGSLARVVEAALGGPPALPSVKTTPEFLCGTEFASLEDELSFFSERGLQLASVQIEVLLRPGELLIFDNLMLAHGRRGIRRPGELDQRVFGHRALPAEEQIEIRARVLGAFA